jgi:hypothetical protein
VVEAGGEQLAHLGTGGEQSAHLGTGGKQLSSSGTILRYLGGKFGKKQKKNK